MWIKWSRCLMCWWIHECDKKRISRAFHAENDHYATTVQNFAYLSVCLMCSSVCLFDRVKQISDRKYNLFIHLFSISISAHLLSHIYWWKVFFLHRVRASNLLCHWPFTMCCDVFGCCCCCSKSLLLLDFILYLPISLANIYNDYDMLNINHKHCGVIVCTQTSYGERKPFAKNETHTQQNIYK